MRKQTNSRAAIHVISGILAGTLITFALCVLFGILTVNGTLPEKFGWGAAITANVLGAAVAALIGSSRGYKLISAAVSGIGMLALLAIVHATSFPETAYCLEKTVPSTLAAALLVGLIGVRKPARRTKYR